MLKAILTDTVRSEWLDYNGHMNVVYYHQLFDRATDKLLERIGLGSDYAATGVGSVFALEDHFVYRSELRLGTSIAVDVQLLDADHKRIHFFQWLRAIEPIEKDRLAATCEHLSVYVDFATRRSAPFPDSIAQKIRALQEDHRALARPELAGRSVGIRKSSNR